MIRMLVVLLALSLAAPAGAVVFRWANDLDSESLDPYQSNTTFPISLKANIYEPLVRRSRTLGLEPALATRWERTSPTVWRFHLRPGVRFAGGEAFTAADVVFSVQRVRTQNSRLATYLNTVSAVRQIDELTVDFETAQPDPILLESITGWGIMSRAWCEAHRAEDVARTVSGEENFASRNANGTGPFMILSREQDRRTVMRPNPGWWDTPEHNLTEVRFEVIGNAATRVAALLSGEVDMIYTVPPQDAARLETTPGLRMLTGPELRTIYLGMDQWRPELLKSDVKGRNPFRDVRVRRAMALAIDEDAIGKRIMRGQAHPTWLMWGPGVNGYDAKLDQRPVVDLVQSRKLLAEAGYPEGFAVTLDCPNNRYVNDEGICQAVTAMLARVGVRVSLSAQAFAKFSAETAPPEYRASFYLLGWTPTTYDAHNVLFNLAGTRNGVRGATNIGGYSNARVDGLGEQIAVELDPARRLALIGEAARLIQEDVGFIPLHQQQLGWAARTGVELVQPADNTFPLRWVRVAEPIR